MTAQATHEHSLKCCIYTYLKYSQTLVIMMTLLLLLEAEIVLVVLLSFSES